MIPAILIWSLIFRIGRTPNSVGFNTGLKSSRSHEYSTAKVPRNAMRLNNKFQQIRNPINSMKNKTILCGLLLASLCGSVQAFTTTNTFYLYNQASGNWNSADQRIDDNYQLGHSYALNVTTTDSAGYFIYDFSPIKQWFGSGTITTNNIIDANM